MSKIKAGALAVAVVMVIGGLASVGIPILYQWLTSPLAEMKIWQLLIIGALYTSILVVAIGITVIGAIRR